MGCLWGSYNFVIGFLWDSYGRDSYAIPMGLLQNPQVKLSLSSFSSHRLRRSRRLPAGVRALPIQTRTTPDRQAKGSKVRVAGQPQAGSQSQSQPMPDPDAIEVQDIDIDLDRSPGSDMDEGSGDSAGTVVDWVIFI